jgi:small subunit ribosomal protein S2
MVEPWWNNRENILYIPNLTIQQLLEAGVHLGHKTFRWNPKMKNYIFGKRNSVHIIDLVQTIELINEALLKVSSVIANGGKILFVSTKKQAADSIANLAKDTSQHYVNFRWLGGMLTNWKTISNSIKKLKQINEALGGENVGFTKKEIIKMGLKRDKLERSLGGILEMKGIPDLIFIIDTNYEKLAIEEAVKLNIPIIAILDTNSDPTNIDYPIPGNDDARRAINLYCDLLKETIQNSQKEIKISNKNDEINTTVKEIKVEEKKDNERLIDKIKKKVISTISKEDNPIKK